MTLDTQDATTLAAVQGIVFDVQRFRFMTGRGCGPMSFSRAARYAVDGAPIPNPRTRGRNSR